MDARDSLKGAHNAANNLPEWRAVAEARAQLGVAIINHPKSAKSADLLKQAALLLERPTARLHCFLEEYTCGYASLSHCLSLWQRDTGTIVVKREAFACAHDAR